MSKAETLVDFEGVITFSTIEMLLTRLRNTREFQEMKKPERKRLYGIFVEAIDNAFKYTAKLPGKARKAFRPPSISVVSLKDHAVVRAGNLILNDDIGTLTFKLDRVNQLDNESLKSLYAEVINRESSASDTGAGLGLITMALRTEIDIEYSFSTVNSKYSFFEIKITLNG